jgi:mono/diheme cytochrome c family protein
VKRAVLTTVVLCALGAGCRGQTTEESPIVPLRNMHFQQRYMPQSRSAFFGDHRTMRTPVAGTVSREEYIEDDRVGLGLEPNGAGYTLTIPEPVVRAAAERSGNANGMEALVRRGQERYEIYCTPCHGRTGDGQGIVVVRASSAGYTFPPPPTFHQDRIRHMPDGQLFATISNGVRNMPSYAAQIPVQDRWAIVAYVRALELSQSNTGAAQ